MTEPTDREYAEFKRQEAPYTSPHPLTSEEQELLTDPLALSEALDRFDRSMINGALDAPREEV